MRFNELPEYIRSNARLKIFFFTHPDLYNDIMVIIAYTEDHARDIIDDYDHEYAYDGSTYILHDVKPISAGVKYYSFD